MSMRPDVVDVGGHKMHLDATDSLLLSVNGNYEEMEQDLFSRCIKPGDTVVDIGAHIGLYTLRAAAAVGPEGHVIAFEPMSTNFALLSENVTLNGYGRRVALHNTAVSDSAGTARLGKSDLNTGDNSLTGERSSGETVTTVVLDEVLGEGARIDVLKMDIQGGEPMALAGAARCLAANGEVVLCTEVSPADLPGGTASYLDTLVGMGFALYEVSETDHALRPTSPDEVVAATADFTNLVCAKGAGAQQRVAGLAANAHSNEGAKGG